MSRSLILAVLVLLGACGRTESVTTDASAVAADRADAPSICFVDSEVIDGLSLGLRAAAIQCKERDKVVEALNNTSLAFDVVAIGCFLIPDPTLTKVAAGTIARLSLGTRVLGYIVSKADCDPHGIEQQREMDAIVCARLAEEGKQCAKVVPALAPKNALDLATLQTVSLGNLLAMNPMGVAASVDELTSARPGQSVELVKQAWADVIGDELVNVRYRLEFNYDAHHYGHGAYLTDLRLVPLGVSAPGGPNGAKLSVTFDDPVNIGTQQDPRFVLHVHLTWDLSALDIGDQPKVRTDELTIDTLTGGVTTTLSDFECKGALCAN